MDDMSKAVKDRVAEILDEVRALRHDLHRIPELAMEEKKTRVRLAEALEGLPLRVWDPLLGTDLIADLDVGADETLCLRADMDALPVEEATGLPYASTHLGRMHACGHDGHMSILVGAARVLCDMRSELGANVRFVFQPGEEVRCAGRDLVAAGACEGAQWAFALHGWPGAKPGVVSAKAGVLMAAGGFYTVRVIGQGCHGAMPERGHNPIPVAGRVADALQDLHDAVHAEYGAVVSTCAIAGGSNYNVIPGEAMVRGTMRYLEEAQIEGLERGIREAVERGVAGAEGIRVEINMERVYDLPVINTELAYERFKHAAAATVPPDMVQEVEASSMGCEDFAYFLRDREGLMFRLGVGEDAPSLHSPTFNFSDGALENGMRMMVALACGA